MLLKKYPTFSKLEITKPKVRDDEDPSVRGSIIRELTALILKISKEWKYNKTGTEATLSYQETKRFDIRRVTSELGLN